MKKKVLAGLMALILGSMIVIPVSAEEYEAESVVEIYDDAIIDYTSEIELADELDAFDPNTDYLTINEDEELVGSYSESEMNVYDAGIVFQTDKTVAYQITVNKVPAEGKLLGSSVKIDIPADTTRFHRISIQNSENTPVVGVRIYDGAGKLLAQPAVSGTNAYFLFVGKSKTAVSYTFQILTKTTGKYKLTLASILDPERDTAAEATELEQDKEYSGYLCSGSDVDVFKLLPKATSNYNITVTNKNESTPVAVKVVDAKGTEVKAPYAFKAGETYYLYLSYGTKIAGDIGYTVKFTKGEGGEDPNPNPTEDFPFTDITPNEKDWKYIAAKYAYTHNLMSGTSTNTFDPDKTTTREMMVQIVYSMDKDKTGSVETNPFNDVAEKGWYYKSILWAYGNGITNGMGNGNFGVGTNVTREQVAVFLMQYSKFKGVYTEVTADLTQFTDNDKISSWAQTAMGWANANGLVNGKGNGIIDPTGNATRAEIATMVMRYCEKFIAN